MALLVAAALAGVFIGICSGLLGIGGGMVMVPLFRLAFGMTPIGATATSLFAIIPTSISGGVQHIRNHTCLPKLGIAMGVGGAITSSLGVALAQVAPGWTIMAVAAVIIGYSAITMFQKALAAKPNSASATTTNTEPDDIVLTRTQLLQGAAIGAAAGFFSGFIGVGGGFIMVPLMLAFIGIPMRLASGTSLVAVMLLVTPAAIEQCLLGNVNYLVGLAIICGSIPGAIIGARLVKRVPERTLRFAFGFFLLLAAILLLVKELGLLG
ncbi:MAG: sulfite exporter TauE/SafE family protein [Eggerthellaceae bacterium]|nr:sulfite exporter TauE/SafE family protein [Eggerthellaceae bacterium]